MSTAAIASPGETSPQVETSPPPKSRKPRKPKEPAQAKPTKKVWFYLSDDAIKRLGVHATMEGRDRSAVVDQLITEGLRRWRVQELGSSDRAKPDGMGIGVVPSA